MRNKRGGKQKEKRRRIGQETGENTTQSHTKMCNSYVGPQHKM